MPQQPKTTQLMIYLNDKNVSQFLDENYKFWPLWTVKKIKWVVGQVLPTE